MYTIILLLFTPCYNAWNGIIAVSSVGKGGVQLIYPSTPNYTSYAPSFNIPLAERGAAVYFNSNAYFIGGHIGGVPQSTVTKFDPITNTSTTVAPLHTARYDHDVTVVSNTLIVCAGTLSSSTYTGTCERSNTVVSSWTFITPLPAVLMGSSMVTLNNSPYVIGGYDSASIVATVYMWDGVSTWQTKQPIPSARYTHNAVELTNNTALVCGGTISGNADVATCYVYTATTNTWTAVANMAAIRSYHGLVMLDSEFCI
jgi:hypothetical protein